VRDLQAARRAPLNPSPADEPTGATGADVETSPVVPGRRPQLWPLFASVALLGLALDVVTKVVVVRTLEPGVGVSAVGNLLTLRLIRNPGAAFSQGEGFTWVFAVAAVLVLAFVGVRLVPKLGHVGWAVALGLLVAGVTGNLADRLFRAPGPFRGHVVDFLQLPHWPIFNVADMCITSAAVMIVVLSVLKNVGIDGRRPGDEASAQDPSAATPADPTSA
jgi:signal peptidase II